MFKLHNYKTPRLAAYADDSADARSMAYTEILSVFAIVYGTDNILVVVDAVRREFVSERSCMFWFKHVVRGNFLPLKIRQTHEVSTQFHNLGFRKTKFLSSPSKQLHVFIVVLVPTISSYFSAIDVDSVPHFSTMRFLMYDANSACKCGKDDAGVAPALGLLLRHLLVLTSTTKLNTEKPITRRAGKISIARTNFLPARFLRHRYVSTLKS